MTHILTGMTRREFIIRLAAAGLIPPALGESRAMEQRISVVTLGVDHLDRSRQFYVDGLGWTPGFENEEIIFFQIGGMVFALFLRDKLAEDFQGDSRRFGRAAMSLGHNVHEKSEVDRLMKRAGEAGAKILKPAEDKSWGGYSGYFADPDGFLWEVAWNPGWRLAADGSVTLR